MELRRVKLKQEIEHRPIEAYLATLDSGDKVRTLIVKNPVTGEPDVGYVLKDVADALSYHPVAFKRIFTRSNWLKKYLAAAVIAGTDGKMYNHDVIVSKEAVLGGFMKLQTSRIKDPEKRTMIDQIQEQLMTILAKVLKGYQSRQTRQAQMAFYLEDDRRKARLETLKAVSGAQIRAILKAYGPYTGRKVLSIMFGIDEEQLKVSY